MANWVVARQFKNHYNVPTVCCKWSAAFYMSSKKSKYPEVYELVELNEPLFSTY